MYTPEGIYCDIFFGYIQHKIIVLRKERKKQKEVFFLSLKLSQTVKVQQIIRVRCVVVWFSLTSIYVF